MIATKPKPIASHVTKASSRPRPGMRAVRRAVKHFQEIPVPIGKIDLRLLHQREGNWSAGYKVACGDLLACEGAVAGNYRDEREALAGVCEPILKLLHRQLDVLGFPADKTRIRQVANAVRKFRARHESKRPIGTSGKPAEATGKPGTALAPIVTSAAGVIDAVEWRAVEKLTAEERRQLATLERAILKNSAAVFKFGAALKTIRDARLYRATHASFEAYCAERWGISKSDGHRQIAAAAKYEAAAPIAERLGIELRCESQMRTLVNVPDDELLPKMKLAKRLAGDGPVTAQLLARAVKQDDSSPDDSSPDDLKRERAAAAARKNHAEGRDKLTHILSGAPPVAACPPAAADKAEPFFPRLDSIGQACCYVRSWIGAMMRQFGDAELAELAVELRRQADRLAEMKDAQLVRRAK